MEVSNGKVKVMADPKAMKNKRQKEMSCGLPEDERVFLIIGGGKLKKLFCAQLLK